MKNTLGIHEALGKIFRASGLRARQLPCGKNFLSENTNLYFQASLRADLRVMKGAAQRYILSQSGQAMLAQENQLARRGSFFAQIII